MARCIRENSEAWRNGLQWVRAEVCALKTALGKAKKIEKKTF